MDRQIQYLKAENEILRSKVEGTPAPPLLKIDNGRVVCRYRLSGVLEHYHQPAA